MGEFICFIVNNQLSGGGTKNKGSARKRWEFLILCINKGKGIETYDLVVVERAKTTHTLTISCEIKNP